MRLATPLVIVFLAVALLSGCGSSDEGGSTSGTQAAPKGGDSTAPAGASAQSCAGQAEAATGLRATGVDCKQARLLMAKWVRSRGCTPPDGASRSSCKLKGDYDCLAAMTDRGLAVSCARPGRSIAFTVKPG
ncbi:MAG: hypothetical protein JJE35_03880 [Thermoleophilia bacterium]|nr:hypothetical protein [Thermoleophilia bacterium]